MDAQGSLCIRHPDNVAKRKCYQCLSPICPQCQKRAFGHIFCSARCQGLYWLSERASGLRRLFLRASLRYRRLEKASRKLTGGGIFRLVTIVLLLVLLYQTGVMVSALRDISAGGETARYPAVAPTAGIVHEGEWITIAGNAPDFSVAVLYADGVEKDVCSVREGRYSFTVKADGATRSYQVQVFGDGLPTLYTRAVPAPTPAVSVSEAPGPAPKTENAPEPVPDTADSVAVKGSPVSAAPRAALREPPVEDDLSRGLPETGVVAITFDGGSYSNAAERILDVLSRKGLKATFFLTGEFMERYPEVTRRIAEEGHEVGNHTYSHLHLTTFGRNYRQETLPGVTRGVLQEELERNERLFESLTGARMVKLWRAPYGEQNEEIRLWALKAGYRHVSWTYDPKTRKSLDGLDWVSDRASGLYLSSDEIVEKIISFDTETELGLAGGIVLLHLGSERDSDPFHPRLGELIDRLQKKGYKVGSVSQLLHAGS